MFFVKEQEEKQFFFFFSNNKKIIKYYYVNNINLCIFNSLVKGERNKNNKNIFFNVRQRKGLRKKIKGWGC